MPPPQPQPQPPRPPLLTRALGSFRQTLPTMALVWGSARAGTSALGLLTIAASFLPPAMAYVAKLIVDGVVAARGADVAAAAAAQHRVVGFVLWEVGLAITLTLVERSLSLVRQLVGARIGIDINLRILTKALTLELPQFENPEFYDKLTRARREASSRPLLLVSENFQIIRSGLTLAGYTSLLLAFEPWMFAVVLAAAVPAFISETRFSSMAFRLRNWRSPDARRLNYLEYVLANDEHAKEVKLFGIGPTLLHRYETLSSRFYEEDKRLAVRRTGWAYVLSVVSTLAFYGCYVVVVLATVTQKLSLGDMTLYLVAFRQGQQSFQGILTSLNSLYEHNLYMQNLFEYLAIPTARAASQNSVTTAVEEGIRFADVGFKYPDADHFALRHVNLFIPKGQSLALVGENGAGKTTFIKLLTGLYEPTEGLVLLDGKDVRAWSAEELRKRVGVIFQDFNQYQFLLRENVGVGSVDSMSDDARITRAVERGGATLLVQSLTQGLDTQLGRWFKDGAELSGGQWQKVALARAFMREEADILILDEPTAALDAEAEHAVFQRFRELSQGRTTIVISHRFPTVRMADRIIVLAGGEVAEMGTHAELVAKQGRYAHLFALQAAGYQ
ncbi:MAG: ABC transporter ATP-binding protein [Deltaproteobacteria bacterium]|nr:ABC transporter ATP-binding protein [Deltaproteobacteria bacterium]